ncbi:TatD family deoxyribonuclease [Alteromonas sp. 38]|uniref:TatD family hydrolase n=1 Tax=Alteromonas TaxID=226 RepID=UPI0012F3662A|nr:MULTISPECIES: TatD family hydrolase [Alteromonas]CAD5266379.1 TatD family deoxyribonuclease [Alteromonas sp. 154]VXC06279.1 TatD family deoxyribonuclease [Alteromonas sp. 38]
MIDSHCHLDLPAFQGDWQSVISHATSAGLTRILIPGTQVSQWSTQLAIQSYANQNTKPISIDIACGLHPYFLSTHETDNDSALSILERLLSQSSARMVALGEIGLDGHIALPMLRQKEIFEVQLRLASEYALPVILHHRKSHHLIFESLKKTGFAEGGVIHAFSGSIEVAKAYIEKGFYIGVGGTITYDRAKKTKETIVYLLKHHPDRLLLETDSPDMPMQGRQGARNSPEYLGEVLEALGKLGEYDTQTLDAITTQNYFTLFHNTLFRNSQKKA